MRQDWITASYLYVNDLDNKKSYKCCSNNIRKLRAKALAFNLSNISITLDPLYGVDQCLL